jgi:carboxyl-terminal processing protease
MIPEFVNERSASLSLTNVTQSSSTVQPNIEPNVEPTVELVEGVAKIKVMKKSLVRIFSLFTLLLCLCFGFMPQALAFTTEQQLLNEAWRIVNQSYVDGTFNGQNWRQLREKALKQNFPNREATYSAIRQLLTPLDDPFTRLLPPAQYRSLQTSTAGELIGVGIQISLNTDTGYLEVIAPIEGSPAALAGLQPRDQILKIDDTLTSDLTLDEAAERMRGTLGSAVVLQIQRQGRSGLEDVTLKRDHISIHPVRSEVRKTMDGRLIGYVRLSQFNANAVSEMSAAIKKLEARQVQGYVLDLRNNPGGLLQSGVDIADLWMDPNPIVYTVDRHGLLGSFEDSSDALTHAPLVVLVNHGTASASEILAGALQDTGRAKLIGERTFGKGAIQSLFDLSDGSGLAVTIATYETPSHRNINKVGIEPDQVIPPENVPLDGAIPLNDRQYQAAVDTLTQVIAGASL